MINLTLSTNNNVTTQVTNDIDSLWRINNHKIDNKWDKRQKLINVIENDVMKAQEWGEKLNTISDKKVMKIRPKKEKKLYFNEQQTDEVLHFTPSGWDVSKKIIHTFNLGKLSNAPTRLYNKIKFLGDLNSNGWGATIKWGDKIYDNHHIKDKGINLDIKTVLKKTDNNISSTIKNIKITNDNMNNAGYTVQNVTDTIGEWTWGWMEGSQGFGVSWFRENYTYYVQVFFNQYLDWRADTASLDCSMKIGKGIKLYNEESILNKNQYKNNGKTMTSNFNKNLINTDDNSAIIVNKTQTMNI